MATLAAADAGTSAHPSAMAHSTTQRVNGAVPRFVELLDGGTGEELFKRGLPDDRKIWSATALVHESHHELLVQVHQAFLDAGADLITCNNYSVTPGVGFSEADIVKYTTVAGTLACEARSRFHSGRSGRSANANTSAQVCGSLPPLLESYRADRVMAHDEGVRLYGAIGAALAPHVDVFLAETLSSVAEAKMALVGVQELRKPVMVSFTLNRHGEVRSGERVDDAVSELLQFTERETPGVALRGVLFNCSQPEHVSIALRVLQSAREVRARLTVRGVRLGAYANRLSEIAPDWTLHESAAPQSLRADLSERQYADVACEWVALGAEIIGGCCGIGPEYIRSLDARFAEQGWRTRS